MKTEKFNWTDAWLLLAIAYASSGENKATLEKIIAIGDALNHAVFNADEVESGLVRLTSGKYIKEKNGIFSVTPKVRRMHAATNSRRQTVEKELEYFRKFIGAAAPASAPPQLNNLKYEGFSHANFREAVDKYLSPLKLKKFKENK